MKDFTWGGGTNFLGVGVMDLVCSHFWGEHMAQGKNWCIPIGWGCGGGWGAEAPALLGCTVKLVLRCYVKLNFYLTLNYVSQFKKVYIH